MLTIDQIAQPSYGIVNSYSTSPLFCQRNSSAARFEQKGDSSLRCRRPLESHDSQLELPPTRVKGQVKKPIPVTTLFVDVGGVLPPNGWDHHARKRAAKHFKLNWAEMDERHRLVFEIHEERTLAFEEYLGWVVFFEKRPFTRTSFGTSCLLNHAVSKVLGLVAQLKAQYNLSSLAMNRATMSPPAQS